MATIWTLCGIWAVITVVFATLLLYRRSLTKQETDWIPLTDDGRESKAIEAQTIIEMKTQKLTVPIRTLGTLSILIMLVILGVWLFHSITTPPPMPE